MNAAAIAAEEEKLKEKNMERKLAIIEEVRILTESSEDFNKKYQEFKSLQQEWRDIPCFCGSSP